LTAAELAGHLGSTLEGAGVEGAPVVLTGAAPIESAGPADLAFAANEKAFPAARRSHAGCVIVPPTYGPEPGQTVILSPHPRELFAAALPLLYPPRALQPGVHPTAAIEPGADIDPSAEIGAHCSVGQDSRIGGGTRLSPGCHIGRDVHIGAGCVLYAAVVIYDHTRIGDRVILHSGSVIGADGFGFTPRNGQWVKFPQVGFVEIEDDVEIGANSCVDRAALGRTRIGRGSKLDNMVHVGHHCDIGCHVVIAAQTGLSGGVVIGDGAIIGGQVGVGDKARIEPGVVLGSGSGVLTSKIVRAGEPLWGTPARPLRQYLEQLALFARLPELRDRLKALETKMEKEK
jgi:UDP-3-O-[3-hydroxymyristoyl] glucosamine N-acyltransferase